MRAMLPYGVSPQCTSEVGAGMKQLTDIDVKNTPDRKLQNSGACFSPKMTVPES
jgi:hypothetical protein